MMGIRRSQSHIKSWEECTRQQQHNRKKVLAHDIKGTLHVTCESKGFEAHSVKHQNIPVNIEIIEILGPFSDTVGKIYCVLVIRQQIYSHMYTSRINFLFHIKLFMNYLYLHLISLVLSS